MIGHSQVAPPPPSIQVALLEQRGPVLPVSPGSHRLTLASVDLGQLGQFFVAHLSALRQCGRGACLQSVVGGLTVRRMVTL
ncbi:unnamed protein product [Heligmosomoides polygyrus]|uniref:Ski_Sno domain-containing protein n=1 Tax=Heligmosomoides polygyrus TaxID=6339 RepID=A0A183G754_HELPZ|nr:unnamed protein product [Heligmosomoides polygyrus]